MTRPPSAEGALGAAVGDLQEQLAHGGVDGVTDQVGIEGFQHGLAGQDLGGHGGRVGHAAAADGLHQRLLDDPFFNVEGQFAGALLGSTPANAVRQAADILDLAALHPLALFGDGSGAMVGALFDAYHFLDFS